MKKYTDEYLAMKAKGVEDRKKQRAKDRKEGRLSTFTVMVIGGIVSVGSFILITYPITISGWQLFGLLCTGIIVTSVTHDLISLGVKSE